MNIIVTPKGAVVFSFTTPPVVSRPVVTARPWRKPGEAVLGLLDRAKKLARAGRTSEASALEAEAERLFDLLPA